MSLTRQEVLNLLAKRVEQAETALRELRRKEQLTLAEKGFREVARQLSETAWACAMLVVDGEATEEQVKATLLPCYEAFLRWKERAR